MEAQRKEATRELIRAHPEEASKEVARRTCGRPRPIQRPWVHSNNHQPPMLPWRPPLQLINSNTRNKHLLRNSNSSIRAASASWAVVPVATSSSRSKEAAAVVAEEDNSRSKEAAAATNNNNPGNNSNPRSHSNHHQQTTPKPAPPLPPPPPTTNSSSLLPREPLQPSKTSSTLPSHSSLRVHPA